MNVFLRSLMSIAFVLFLGQTYAQDRAVSGTVTDENGASLPGVNVVVKGTTTGTVTDIDGSYRLNVPSGSSILSFTFIGYAPQELEIGNRSIIDVQLASDVTELSEVVVTAQGIQREKRSLGYSVENISSDQVQQISEPDAVRALQGKVPGVNIQGSSSAPGASTRITIRGNSSLLNSNEPLFVVDGIPFNTQQNSTASQLSNGAPYSSRISDIDPNNIESITVLKGAAAAALYGVRAANGVILITTKTGSGRASKKGLEITFSNSYSVEEVAKLPDYQNTYGAGSDFDYGNVNGSWGPAFAELDSIPHWFGEGQGSGVGAAEFPQFSVFDADGNPTGAINIPFVAQPDNVEDFFQRGFVLENSVSISGGNDNAVMTAVLSRTENEGIIPESEFQRYQMSIGGKAILDNGLSVGGNFAYTYSEQDAPITAGNALGATSITSRLLWLNRTWPLQDFEQFPFENPITGGNVFPVTADNPYYAVENNRFNSQVNRFVGNVSFSYDLNDWLSASYKIGVNQYTDERFQSVNPGSNGRNGIGEIINDRYFWQEIESNILITFSKDINKDFDVTATVGHSWNQRRNDNQTIVGTGIISRDIINLDNVANLSNPNPPDLGVETRRLIGAYYDVSFGYRDFAFINTTGRNDWSSTLPVNNRSFFYPSVSGSFIFTEAFNLDSNVLSFGKVRGGWSRVGNDAPPYLLSPIFQNNPTFGNNANSIGLPLNTPTAQNVSGATQGNVIGNPALTPEFTRELEAGLDVKFFNNRIGIDATYYFRKTTDQIIAVRLPSESGFTSQVTNIGEVTNEGVELGIDVTPVSLNNGLNWNVYGSFTLNRNEVVDIGDVESLNITPTFGNPNIQLIPGEEYGVLTGTYFVTDEDDNFLVNPTNGRLIESLDTRVIGNPNPDFLLGITNTVNYKGISFRVVFDWKQGGDLYSATNQTFFARGVTADTEDREASIVIPGFLGDANTGEPILDAEGNKIPNTIQTNANRLFFNNFGFGPSSEKDVYDATVYRLREVALSYSLPKSLLESTPFGSVSISLTGRNLWYNAPNFPDASNFDPETNTFGATNAQGLEFRTYLPSVRRYGVNLKFTL
ncbi:MAG: SusC/RagA family TonB-linked outer membrane protein [Bacteroidota bacterium]